MVKQSYQLTAWEIMLSLLVIVLSMVISGGFDIQAAPSKPLKMAVLQLEPYGFLTEDQQLTGILSELAERLRMLTTKFQI